MKPWRILVVEDDALIAIALERAFRSAGCIVELARDLATASKRLAAPPIPDLMTLDIELPDGDGLEILERSNTPSAIMVVTSHDTEAERSRAFAAGAKDYVVKPFHARAIVLGAQAILQRDQQS